ncbi:hypothetical protein ACP70R_017839 [Stipagrostis hirtigluma subsp. patula]
MESHSRRLCRSGAMEAGEEDRLSGLPDDLLHPILRDLPLKQAARTSALSWRWARARQWLRALATSPVVDFTDRDFARSHPPAQAAATVGRYLQLHAAHGVPLEAFRVALDAFRVAPLVSPLGLGDGALGWEIIWWVATAVGKGAREVEVDLAPPPTQGEGDADHRSTALLGLPGDLFQATNSLERLALGGFSLRAVPPAAAGLAGLRSLSLSHTDVTDEAVRGVLASCRALESLSLRGCHLLSTVCVASKNLRALELVHCSAVRKIRVDAPALESFAFQGGIMDALDRDDFEDEIAVELGATPALRDAYVSHLGLRIDQPPHDHNFYDNVFLYRVEHAQILTLCSVGLQTLLDIDAYGHMPNLQELQLLMSPDEDDLEYVSSFFMMTAGFYAANRLPLLERLFIRLLEDDPIGGGGAAAALAGHDDGADVVLYEFVLGQLTFIKVVNFRGTRRELGLLRFLLKRAPVLEQLVLVTPEAGGALGDEELRNIQGQVSALQRASPEARVTVCRPSEDDSLNPAHTRFYHEE